MAYTFIVDGEEFSGRTVPGAKRMRIFHQKSNSFIAAYDPDDHTLLGNKPSGSWVDTQDSTDPAWLKKLEPEVLIACRNRRLSIKRLNEKTYAETGPIP